MKRRFNGGFSPVRCSKRAKNEKFEISKKHLESYLNELKLHFDLTDNEVYRLLCHQLDVKKPKNPFLKYIDMLKLWN